MFNSIFGRLFTTCVLVILIALLLAVSLSVYLIRMEYLDNTAYKMEAYRSEVNESYLNSGIASVSNLSFFNSNMQFASEEDILLVVFDQNGGYLVVRTKDHC